MNEWKSCGTSETDYNTQQIEPLLHFLCIGYEKVYNLVSIGASDPQSAHQTLLAWTFAVHVYKLKQITMSLTRKGIKSGKDS